jgi:hypothetical protein
MEHQFSGIFPGNKIPDWFSHREEISNTDWCGIDINEPLHLDFEITIRRDKISSVDWCEIDINEPLGLDLENTIFAFSAVIGIEDVQGEGYFQIVFEVINNGQLIYCHRYPWIDYTPDSDHVYLHYHGSHHSRLKIDNLRVIFKFERRSCTRYVFLKTCGFHLQHRYEEEAIDLTDGIQHSKRCRGDDDHGNLESNCYPQQKRPPSFHFFL